MVMNEEYRKLHEAVSAKFNIGDYDTFVSKMQTEDDRKNFFEAVSAKGFSLGDYNDYEKRLSSGGTDEGFIEGSGEQPKQPSEPLKKPIVDVDLFGVSKTDDYLAGARKKQEEYLKSVSGLISEEDSPSSRLVSMYSAYDPIQLDSALNDIDNRLEQTNFYLGTRGLTQPERKFYKEEKDKLNQERAAAIVYKAERTNDYDLSDDARRAVIDIGPSSPLGKKLRPEVYKLESRIAEDVLKEVESRGVDFYDLTEEDFNGVRRADAEKVADLADEIAESIAEGNRGVRQVAYERIFDRAEKDEEIRMTEEKIKSDSEIQDIFSRYRSEGLDEFESTNKDGIRYKAEFASAVKAINSGAEFKLNKLSADYNSDVNSYKQELQSQVNQGIITPEDANKQLSDYNKQLYSDLQNAENLIIQNNKQDLEELTTEYYKKIEGGFKRFLQDNPMNPDDLQKLNDAVKRVSEEVNKERFGKLKSQEMMSVYKYGGAALIPLLGKSINSTLSRYVSGAGTYFDVPWMVEFGDEMNTAFSVADERVEDWSDLANIPAVTKSIGRLAGSALPSILVGAAVSAGTGGLGTVPAMGLVALASWMTESIDMGGNIKRDVIRETGSLLKGEQAAGAMWEAQLGNWWTYIFDGLPYVGKALRAIPSRAARIGIAGAESVLTETPQETFQTAQEQQIMQTVFDETEITARGFSDRINQELVKETFLEVAPGSFALGGGVRAFTEFMMDRQADKLVKEMVAKTRAGLVDDNESFIRQKIFASMNQFGKNFTNSWLSTLQKNGVITEEDLNRLYTYSKTAEGFLRNVSGLNLTEEQKNTYFALSHRANELYNQAESITDDKVTRATLTEQANTLKKNAQDFLNNPETGGSFVSVQIGKGPALIMNEQQAIEFVESNPYVAFPEAGVTIQGRNVDEFTRVFGEMVQGAEAGLADLKSIDDYSKQQKEDGRLSGVDNTLTKINNADYINDNEIDAGIDQIFTEIDRVDGLDISDNAKESIKQQLYGVAEILDNYEFRTKTETRKVTPEESAEGRAEAKREIPKKSTSNAKVTGVGNVTVTFTGGNTISITPEGQRGQDARVTTFTYPENFLYTNEEGDFTALAIEDAEGNEIIINDPEVGIPLAMNNIIAEMAAVPTEVVDQFITEEINYIKERKEAAPKPREAAPTTQPVEAEAVEEVFEDTPNKIYHNSLTTKALEQGVLLLPSVSKTARIEQDDDAVFFTEEPDWDGRGMRYAKLIFNKDGIKPLLRKGKRYKEEKELLSDENVDLSKEGGLIGIELPTSPQSYDSVISSVDFFDEAEKAGLDESSYVKKFMQEEHNKEFEKTKQKAQELANKYQVPVKIIPPSGIDGKSEIIKPVEEAVPVEEVAPTTEQVEAEAVTEGLKAVPELSEEVASELEKILGLDKSQRKASREGRTRRDNERLDKVERAIDLLDQSLSSVMPNIVIAMAESAEQFALFAEEEGYKREDMSKGIFRKMPVPDSKTFEEEYVIVLNPDSADVVTVFHEGLHAVLRAAGLSNAQAKAVTGRMIDAVKKTATKKLQRELEEFTEMYETPQQNEEYIAELIGILANNYNEQNNETKSLIRRWLEKLAEILGLKPKGAPLSSVGLGKTDAAIVDTLNFVAQKMSEGGVLTEQDLTRLTQPGEEVATSLIMEEEISTPGSQILGGTDIRKSKQAKVKDFDTTPPKVDGVKMIYPEKTSIDDVLEKSGGAAIFINSDGTKVGKVVVNGRELILQGGIDYTFIEQNVKDDIGFAASEDKKISQLKTAASDLVAERDRKNPEHKGKPIAVFVASQNGETMLGEWYAAEYIMEGLDASIVNKKYNGGLKQAEKDFVEAIKSAKVGKTEDGLRDKKSKDALLKMVEDGKFKTHEGRLDIAKKLASKDFSFGFRVNLNKDLLSNKESASKTGKNVNFKKSLAESGYFLNDFWNKFIDERFLKGIQQERLQNEKGKTVAKKTFSGFFYDPSESLESQINHAKLGVDHAQFNSSFKSKGNFLLDSAYDVNKLFPLMGYPEQKGIDIYNEANNTKFVKEAPKRNPLGLVRATIVDKGMISKWLKENGYSNLIVNPYTSIALSLYTGVSGAEEPAIRKRKKKKPSAKIKDAFEWGIQRGIPGIDIKNHLIKLGYTEQEIESGAYDAERVWNKDGKKVKNWFEYARRGALSARGFRTQSMFLAHEAMESAISAELRQAKMMAEALNSAINRYKSQDKRDELLDAVNEFMRDAEERNFWRDELPEDIAQMAQAMRDHIDSLSLKLIDLGVIKADRSAQNILDNIGVYMNRSYEIFDNKNWKNEVSDQVITAAQNHLRDAYYNSLNGIKELDQQLKDGSITEADYNRRKNRILSNKASVKEIMDRDGVTEDEALTMHVDDIIDSILSKNDVNEYILFAQPKIGRKDLRSLKRRKDIPPAIRALMGEYTDPGYNYAMSVFKIANLVESQKYLTKIRDAGLGVWLFEKEAGKKVPEGYEKISFEGDASMNPLDGLYAPSAVVKAFKQKDIAKYFAEVPDIGKVYGYWLKGVGAVKYSKTILSFGTHAKNVIGNMYFMAQNGYLDPREYQQPFMVLAKLFVGKELTAEQEAKMDEWIRAGIIGQGATIGEIKAIFEGEESFEKALAKRIDEKTNNILSKTGRGIKKFGEKSQEAYQYEDDMFKIVAYEKEKLNYSKILFDGKSYNQLDASQQSAVNDYVAEIIKNILPNYGRIGAAGKLFKAFPVAGTFISFQIEAYRTAYNTVALAIKEIKGDIPGASEAGKKLAQKRGAMRLASIIGFQAFKYGMISLFGIPLVPGDDDEDGLSEKIRMLLPFWDTNSDIAIQEVKPNGNFTYVSISASDPYGSIFKVVNATTNYAKTGEDFSEILGELAGPFVSEDILLNTLRNVSNNENDYGGKIWRKTDTPFEVSGKIALQLYKTIEPGSLTSMRKIVQSEKKLNEAIGQLTGFKVHEVKSLEQAGFKFRDIQDEAQESKRAYNSMKNNLDDYETQADVDRVIRATQKAMNDDYQVAVNLYNSLISLGVKPRDIRATMKDNGISSAMRSQIARGKIDVKLDRVRK
jgi:hypothetical protein